MTLRNSAVVGCVCALFPLAAVNAQDAPAPRELFSMTGRDSEVATLRYEFVNSRERFDRVWTEHSGDDIERSAQGWPMPPKLNFDAVSAVFAFGGIANNRNGFYSDSLLVIDGIQRLRFDAITYQTIVMEGEDLGEAGTPWAMWVVDKITGPLILEENVQGLIGGEPVWKPRMYFGADGSQAAGPLSPTDLANTAPEGTRVALRVPIESLTYCRHDANPVEFSWQGLVIEYADPDGGSHTMHAPVSDPVHVRTEIDPVIGSIDHLQTDDGATIAIACNPSYQEGRTEELLLFGSWQIVGDESQLHVDSIVRLKTD